jgi:hypothetical protein
MLYSGSYFSINHEGLILLTNRASDWQYAMVKSIKAYVSKKGT